MVKVNDHLAETSMQMTHRNARSKHTELTPSNIQKTKKRVHFINKTTLKIEISLDSKSINVKLV